MQLKLERNGFNIDGLHGWVVRTQHRAQHESIGFGCAALQAEMQLLFVPSGRLVITHKTWLAETSCRWKKLTNHCTKTSILFIRRLVSRCAGTPGAVASTSRWHVEGILDHLLREKCDNNLMPKQILELYK